MSLERRVERLEQEEARSLEPLEVTVRHTVVETGETTLRRYVDGKLVVEEVLPKQEDEGS